MEVKLSKVDKAPRKDMQGYLEISDRIAKGEEVSASELAFAVEVRKADNEKDSLRYIGTCRNGDGVGSNSELCERRQC